MNVSLGSSQMILTLLSLVPILLNAATRSPPETVWLRLSFGIVPAGAGEGVVSYVSVPPVSFAIASLRPAPALFDLNSMPRCSSSRDGSSGVGDCDCAIGNSEGSGVGVRRKRVRASSGWGIGIPRNHLGDHCRVVRCDDIDARPSGEGC